MDGANKQASHHELYQARQKTKVISLYIALSRITAFKVELVRLELFYRGVNLRTQLPAAAIEEDLTERRTGIVDMFCVCLRMSVKGTGIISME